MGGGESRDESIQHGRLVHMTAISQWRQAYRILRISCGLTHHEARSIFSEHLGGLSFHRNMLASELKKDKQSCSGEADAFALILRSDKVSVFVEKLNSAIWDEGEPQLYYTLVREIVQRVSEWNEWGEDERLIIHEQTRRVLNHESRRGLKEWTERHLMTYLRIRGIAIEV